MTGLWMECLCELCMVSAGVFRKYSEKANEAADQKTPCACAKAKEAPAAEEKGEKKESSAKPAPAPVSAKPEKKKEPKPAAKPAVKEKAAKGTADASALELYKKCYQMGLKPPARKPAEFYEKLLAEAQTNDAQEEEEDWNLETDE